MYLDAFKLPLEERIVQNHLNNFEIWSQSLGLKHLQIAHFLAEYAAVCLTNDSVHPLQQGTMIHHDLMPPFQPARIAVIFTNYPRKY